MPDQYELDKISEIEAMTRRSITKPILVIDFDGVLHSYNSGWKGADVIQDPPTLGAIEFCTKAMEYFEIIIVSSRCNQPGGYKAINAWLSKWNFPELKVSEDGSKPAAFITLDDRAITFNGLWPNLPDLLNFRPWYQRCLNPNDTQCENK